MTVGYDLKDKDDVKDWVHHHVKVFKPTETDKALAILEGLPDRSGDPRFAAADPQPETKSRSQKKTSNAQVKRTTRPKSVLCKPEEIADADTIYVVADEPSVSALKDLGYATVAVDVDQDAYSIDWAQFCGKRVVFIYDSRNQSSTFIRQATAVAQNRDFAPTDEARFAVEAEPVAISAPDSNAFADDLQSPGFAVPSQSEPATPSNNWSPNPQFFSSQRPQVAASPQSDQQQLRQRFIQLASLRAEKMTVEELKMAIAVAEKHDSEITARRMLEEASAILSRIEESHPESEAAQVVGRVKQLLEAPTPALLKERGEDAAGESDAVE